MIYSVRHITTFGYEPAVRESLMEVRMQPRSDGRQRCLSFQLHVEPGTNVMQYRDYMGNMVHHFDIAGSHTRVKITAHAVVEVEPAPDPDPQIAGDWNDLDALTAAEDYWEMLLPSQFAQPTGHLAELARQIKCERRTRPLELLIELNEAIYSAFDYVPNSTKVDSPIDHALENRQGVCQDFAHIMIALLRGVKIPARYVSGYLFHQEESRDRSPDGASHAWVEALVPKIGWVALDPTNNLVGGDRHIRVALGRDYADVPPNRGVYKGDAHSDLSVSVTVSPADRPLPEAMTPQLVVTPRPAQARSIPRFEEQQQQQ